MHRDIRRDMRLHDLPHDILCRIMQLSDQEARKACLVTTKPLHKAALSRGVWTSVTFRDLDNSALEFMERHEVRDVTIETPCPDDVSWFFERLVGMGVNCVADLNIRIKGDEIQRMPRDFLVGICRQTLLRTLTISVENLEHSSEIHFPKDLAHRTLQKLKIVERNRNESPKELVVWFAGAEFPNLRRATVDVALSDVMTNFHNMRALRTLTYRYDEEGGGETYEDVHAVDARLDMLNINVGCDTEYDALQRELAKASIDRLVITVNDDCVDFRGPLSPDVRELVFRMDVTHGIVHLDFVHLKDAKHLRLVKMETTRWVQDAVPMCDHVLEFNHTPSIAEWMAFCQRVTVVCDCPSIKVSIASM